jgi:hypothetical protein
VVGGEPVGVRPRGEGTGQGSPRAKQPRRHGIGRPGGGGDVAGRQWPPSPLLRHRQGQKGKLPFAESPRLGHGRARARRARQLVGPAVPSARAQPRRGPVGAMRRGVGKKAEEDEEVRLTSRPHTSARERKRRRAPAGWAAVFSGLLGLVGPAG